MLSLAPGDALDYAAAFEDAAEELHILGKLVPSHYQYTRAADEVRSTIVTAAVLRVFSLDRAWRSGARAQRSAEDWR